VANQGDGWSHALTELSRYYDRASARMFGPDPISADSRPIMELAASTPPAFAVEVIARYLRSAETLGQRTAEMHLALASGGHRDFEPETLTSKDIDALSAEIEHQASIAIPALKSRLETLSSDIVLDATRLLAGVDAAIKKAAVDQSLPRAAKTRIHGDYHLGQVLWVDNDYVILDFEGEPTRTVEERREKFSPLRDVAGMLRSYHYAAYAGLFAFTEDRPNDLRRLVPWAEIWQQWVSAAFLASYRRAAGKASFLPANDQQFERLLNRHMLAKALYELAYELNNRPDWVRIPLGGVMALLGLSQSNAADDGDNR
jgi:maltose alpha-D-glucosyltransferase / alpha-amylase